MSAQPDFGGAFEKMLDTGKPTTIIHDGWSYSFPHSSGKMVAMRPARFESDEFSFERFKQEYKRQHGKTFRG